MIPNMEKILSPQTNEWLPLGFSPSAQRLCLDSLLRTTSENFFPENLIFRLIRENHQTGMIPSMIFNAPLAFCPSKKVLLSDHNLPRSKASSKNKGLLETVCSNTSSWQKQELHRQDLFFSALFAEKYIGSLSSRAKNLPDITFIRTSIAKFSLLIFWKLIPSNKLPLSFMNIKMGFRQACPPKSTSSLF